MFKFLDGVKVIELGHILLGPHAAQTLGDFGAEIIKIEAPTGDLYREVGIKKMPKMSAQWLSCNRNKRSVVLDLKQNEGRQAIIDLVENADVFVHNMRPFAIEKLGLDYESLKAINPRLVYCFSSGFGQAGPYKDYPAFDDVIQAYSGMASVNGHNLGAPQFVPVAVTDHMASMNLVQAMLAGLYRQQASGKGCLVEVPMYETVVSTILNQHLSGASFDPPVGTVGYPRMLSASRKPCETKDGFVAHGVYSFHHWQAFLPAVDRVDILESGKLDDPSELAANISELYEIVAREIMPLRTTQEWLDLMSSLDIPCAPINSLDDLITDPHLNSVGLFRTIDHPTQGRLTQVRNPMSVTDVEEVVDIPPPDLGLDTQAVLLDLGYSEERLAELADRGVIPSS